MKRKDTVAIIIVSIAMLAAVWAIWYAAWDRTRYVVLNCERIGPDFASPSLYIVTYRHNGQVYKGLRDSCLVK